MTRPARSAGTATAAVVWAALALQFHEFVLVDGCLDAGGAIDAPTRACFGARWPSVFLPWHSWLIVPGLPADLIALVSALFLCFFGFFAKSKHGVASPYGQPDGRAHAFSLASNRAARRLPSTLGDSGADHDLGSRDLECEKTVLNLNLRPRSAARLRSLRPFQAIFRTNSSAA